MSLICREFKIKKNRLTHRKNTTFFNRIKLVSVVHLAYFIVLGPSFGGFEMFVSPNALTR